MLYQGYGNFHPNNLHFQNTSCSLPGASTASTPKLITLTNHYMNNQSNVPQTKETTNASRQRLDFSSSVSSNENNENFGRGTSPMVAGICASLRTDVSFNTLEKRQPSKSGPYSSYGFDNIDNDEDDNNDVQSEHGEMFTTQSSGSQEKGHMCDSCKSKIANLERKIKQLEQELQDAKQKMANGNFHSHIISIIIDKLRQG